MGAWSDYAWVDEEASNATMAATVVIVRADADSAEELLGRLGQVTYRGEMSIDEALDLDGSHYDDGTFEERHVVQVGRPADASDWWVIVEPNGWQAADAANLLALARQAPAASFFWNVNAVMSVLHVQDGTVLAEFDPLLDADRVPDEGRDLPFGVGHPGAAALALLERWTGVVVTKAWFASVKPTFVLSAP